MLHFHHNLTVSVVAGEGEQTRRDSGAANGQTDRPIARTPSRSHWRNRVESTDRLSLSILLSKSLRQGRKREEITRVTFWPRMPLVVRQICKSSAILHPKFPFPPAHARTHTPLTTFRTLGERGDAIIFVGMGHMSSVRRTRSGMGRLGKR